MRIQDACMRAIDENEMSMWGCLHILRLRFSDNNNIIIITWFI